MNRDKLIGAIRRELNRQGQESRSGGLYTYNEVEDAIGVDGMLDLNALADAIEREQIEDISSRQPASFATIRPEDPNHATIVAQEPIEKGDLVTWDGRKVRPKE